MSSTAGMHGADKMTPEETFPAGRANEYSSQLAEGAPNRMALPISLSNSIQHPVAAINFPLSQSMMNQNRLMARAAQFMAASNATSVHQQGFFSPSIAAARAAASNRAVNIERGHALATTGRNDLLPFLALKADVDAPSLSLSNEDASSPADARRRRTQATKSVRDVDTSSKNSSTAAWIPTMASRPETKPFKKLEIPPASAVLPSMENLQLANIDTASIGDNDVLCGRGGGTNNHVGNERFRDLVAAQKLEYMRSSKREKPMVSRNIVRAVRNQNPPGRFLTKEEDDGLWYDIGDQKAREKTSQALREGAPQIRRVISNANAVSPLAHCADDTSDDRHQTTQNEFTASPENAGMFLPATGFHQAVFQASPNAIANHGHLPGSMALSWITQQRERQEDQTASPNQAMLQQPQFPFNDFRGAFPRPVVSGCPSCTNYSCAYSDPRSLQIERNRLLGLGRGSGDFLRERLGARTVGGQGPNLNLAGLVVPTSMGLPDAGNLKRSLWQMHGDANQNFVSEPTCNGAVDESQFSHDCKRRLMLAETVAQETARGTISELLKAEEYRISLYMDAGLLNIDPSEISRYLANGKTESDVVEGAYKKIAKDGKRDNLLPKYQRVHNAVGALDALGALTQQSIQDALQVIIGAGAPIAAVK